MLQGLKVFLVTVILAVLTAAVVVCFLGEWFLSLPAISSFIISPSKYQILGCFLAIILLVIWFAQNSHQVLRGLVGYVRSFGRGLRGTSVDYTIILGLSLVILVVVFSLQMSSKATSISTEVKQLVSLVSWLIVFGAVYLLYLQAKDCSKRAKVKPKQACGFSSVHLSDAPIITSDQDLLNRGEFVERLKQQLINIPFTEGFTFSIHAPWGDGKSSVVNLLTERLAEDAVVVRFDPWYFQNTEAIIRAFYSDLESAFSAELPLPGIGKVFKQYGAIPSLGLSASLLKVDFRSGTQSLKAYRVHIEKYISLINKPVIIFIDDLDRLEPQDLMEVLKLVRLNASFDGVVFVLVYDHREVCRKIGQHHLGGACASSTDEEHRLIVYGQDFLEKVVQKPIALPKIEDEVIARYFLFSNHSVPSHKIVDIGSMDDGEEVSVVGRVMQSEQTNFVLLDMGSEHSVPVEISTLRKEQWKMPKVDCAVFVRGRISGQCIVLNDQLGEIRELRLSKLDELFLLLYRNGSISYEQIEEFDKNFVRVFRDPLVKFLKNLRDVKRLLNSLYSSLPSIAGEIDLSDFVLVEFLKVFLPSLYDDIFENWMYYSKSRLPHNIEAVQLTMRMDQAEFNKKRNEHVKRVVASLGLNPEQVDAVFDILKELFDKDYR